MRRRFGWCAAAFVGCAAIGMWAQMPARDGGDARKALAGTWTLDRDLSDAASGPGGPGGLPGERGRPDRPRRGPGGMGGRGPRMPGGGMPGGRPRPSEEEMARRRALLRELMQPPDRLTIVVEPTEVTITDERGRSWRLVTDGRKEKHQLDNGTVTVRTRWEGDALVRSIDAGDGFELTETYVVAPGDAPRLQVTVKIGRGRLGRARTLTRTYDKAPEGEELDQGAVVGLA
jgi:hypothetical protein